jgi:hypothetical protein
MNRPNQPVAAWIGHLIDLYRISRFRFTNGHSLTKLRQIDALRKRTNASVFVESGTFRGVTAARCARLFERVFTVELDPHLFVEAKEHLQSLKNVEVIHGDAAKEIPQLFATGRVINALVFLDGHFSGGNTACGDTPEPAIQELEALATYRDYICAVIVDDFRCFGVEPGYPRKSNLLRAAEKYYEQYGYGIQVHLDQLLIYRTTTPELYRAE